MPVFCSKPQTSVWYSPFEAQSFVFSCVVVGEWCTLILKDGNNDFSKTTCLSFGSLTILFIWLIKAINCNRDLFVFVREYCSNFKSWFKKEWFKWFLPVWNKRKCSFFSSGWSTDEAIYVSPSSKLEPNTQFYYLQSFFIQTFYIMTEILFCSLNWFLPFVFLDM